MEPIFAQLGLSIMLAVVCAGVARLLKQPLIIGYIVAGVLASPYGFNLVQSGDSIRTFAEIGVAILLFLVGLNLNPKIIKEVGKVSLIAGLGQIIFTASIGFLLALLIGFTPMVAVFIAVALTFSSTIIILKLLSDKGDVETLYGRIAIGILIVQDLAAIFILMTMASMSQGSNFGLLVVNTFVPAILLIVALVGLSITVLPKITRYIARSQEYLLLFAIGWCLALALVFEQLGLSIEAGALMAGISLSTSPFRFEMSSRMRILRDFFLVLFFIWLGSQMVFTMPSTHIVAAIVLSLFVLIGNPLIVLILMGRLGYSKRTAFMTGLTVAQISEFSLIIMALGVRSGYVSQEILSLVTIIGLITIAGSSYMIIYNRPLFKLLSPMLTVFEKKGSKIDEPHHMKNPPDIVLFGYNRIGYDLLKSFRKLRREFLVIDYDPDVVLELSTEGVPCQFGDAADPELVAELDLSDLRMAVSTIPDFDTNMLLIRAIRERKKDAIIICVSHQIDESMKLYDEGATYVIMPHFLGGHRTSMMIEEYGFDLGKFLREKVAHVEHLRVRKQKGHEHPKYGDR